jgi:hypothetical protein
LDSIYLLIRNGGNENEYSAEIKQIQGAITAKNNELKAEIAKKIDDAMSGKIEVEKETPKIDFFAEYSFWDKIQIVMGAIAIAAVIFLLSARIIIAVSKNKKAKKQIPAKEKQEKKPKKELLQKTANVLSEIDRYKEKETQKAEFNESVIASLKELAKNETKETPKPEEEPKKPSRAIELKNEIVRRFDKQEDTAKIAQDLGISKDQVVMILSLSGRK